MSYTTERYSIERLSCQSLAVVQCGIQICDPSHTYGLTIPSCFSISFVLEGKGVYYLEGTEYEISAGQGFVVIPGHTYKLTADKKEPWKYIYASFNGPDDASLVHNAGLDETNPIFDFHLDELIIKDLYAMHEASKRNEALGYDVTGYFMLIISRIIKQNIKKEKEYVYPEYYMKKAVLFIENNYNKNISVQDIAEFINIDRTYLFKLFKRNYGKSPSQWLRDYRLKKSVEMMENKELSIKEVAELCGFYDISHFYKKFTEKYNMTPQKYRNGICEKMQQEKEE